MANHLLRSVLRRLGNLHRNERGVAMTETIVMLPAFLIIWGSVLFIHKRYESYVNAAAVARECAWRRATDACPDEDDANDNLDEICKLEEGTDISDPWNGNDPTADAQSSVSFMDSLSAIIGGKGLVARRETKITRPGVLGGEDETYKPGVALSCNEKASGDIFGNVADSAWDGLAGSL